MDPQEIVLITGANTGLGFQIVRALCGSNKTYNILLAGRSLVKAQQAVRSATEDFPFSRSKLWPIQVDIEDDDSIHRVFDEIQTKFGRLDALVNNAGAQLDQQLALGSMTMRQMWNQSWNVNTVGAQIMTSVFIPLLLQSNNPRLLFITSGTSTLNGTENRTLAVNKYPPKGWPKNNFDGNSFSVPAYRSSKTGMNMMMREWYRMLKEDGVKVWCVSPGFLATGLGGNQEANKNMGAGDPAEAGNFVKSVLEGYRDGDVGKVILRDGVQPW
ncbi:putative short chain dehydrogenase [Lepidopterella palustris CBS 459.81]|uniref:Putative short chain dehydrogenase n=1 Tax=Lepidopterella palustris CBS 459.81 TaxID=1314670 RepID=A0A8E2E853_9PEZI|nr:putative short chain dehydrogenase [Lepidopterella palustris CBS 459.81]